MVELAFNAESHEYSVGGERWPGVTEVLDPINELDGIPRDVLAAAAEFGSHVHQACDLSNRGVLDRAALDPALAPYLAAWEKFLVDTGAVVMHSELRVQNKTLKYAGTLDAVIRWRNATHIADIKTSAAVPRTVGPQTAAYRAAYLQTHGECSPVRYCVHLRADATFRLHKLANPADLSMFVSCLNIYRWRNA